ncbi:MAG: hypothetical protein ACTSUE_13230 [Promethearchaeota archaeon]
MNIKTNGLMDKVYVTVERKDGVDFQKVKIKLEKHLYEAIMMKITVTAVPAGTALVPEGKSIRYKDLRNKPESFR